MQQPAAEEEEEGASVWEEDGQIKTQKQKKKQNQEEEEEGEDEGEMVVSWQSQAVPTRIGLFFYCHHLNLVRKNLKSRWQKMPKSDRRWRNINE